MKDTGAGLIVIFGGRSEIGLELATRLASGATVLLAARRADTLGEEVAAVLAAGAAAVHVREFDADDLASHGPTVESIVTELGAAWAAWAKRVGVIPWERVQEIYRRDGKGDPTG